MIREATKKAAVRALTACVLWGCTKAATKDTAASTKADADASDASAMAMAMAPDAGVHAPSAPASGPVTAFYPFAQGACAEARPVLIGKTPVLHFGKAAWALPADGKAKVLAKMAKPHYDAFVGAVVGEDWLIDTLGGLDEAHVWYTMGSFSGRGSDWTAAYLNGQALKTPRGEYGGFGIHNVIQQPDGEIWTFGRHGIYLDIPGDPKDGNLPQWRYDRWFAYTKDGAPITDRNLPMGDMDLAVRLESGELVAPGISQSENAPHLAQLRRWSPTKKVNDLTADKVDATPELRVGTQRAVLKLKGKNVFHNYVGDDKLTPSNLNGKIASSWLVTKSDELWLTADDKVFVEAKDGTVTEETLPEKGKLAPETSTPWLLGSSGAVYERAGKVWRKLELPDGPWSNAEHPPSQPEWVAVLGNETWVSTVRTDKGFGATKLAPVRTFYSSSKARTPLRCGSPFEASVLGALGPKADASCKDFVVMLGRERGRDGKVAIPYAKIATALKGDAAIVGSSESLTLGVFGDEAIYGIHASTREAADAIAKKLTKLTAHDPEVVCGAADEKRTATLDVKAGKFTSVPDAGAP